MSFDASANIFQSLNTMEECAVEIREWMMNNMLKRKDEKTEVLVISSPHFTEKLKEIHPRVGDASVRVNESARNLM